MKQRSPPEANTTSEQASLLCTLPRTTLLSKPPTVPRTGYHPVPTATDSPIYTGTGPVSMQVTVNPYSTTTGYGTPTHCDTDTEYASVVYSSSPTMARRNLMNPGSRVNSQYSCLTPRPAGQQQTTYLSPQLARLNSTLRPS